MTSTRNFIFEICLLIHVSQSRRDRAQYQQIYAFYAAPSLQCSQGCRGRRSHPAEMLSRQERLRCASPPFLQRPWRRRPAIVFSDQHLLAQRYLLCTALLCLGTERGMDGKMREGGGGVVPASACGLVRCSSFPAQHFFCICPHSESFCFSFLFYTCSASSFCPTC